MATTYRRIEGSGNGTFWKPKDPGSSIEGMFEGRERLGSSAHCS
jgi:hypothetical protein